MKKSRIKVPIPSKPSILVRAMCDGLEELSKRCDFCVDMNTFGRIRKDYDRNLTLCFGCAAACALIKLAKEEPENYIRNNDSPATELEMAIDRFRSGDYFALFDIFTSLQVIEPKTKLQPLCTDSWKENLPAYKKYAEQLEKAGF